MATSNAEVLAQLERLAEIQQRYVGHAHYDATAWNQFCAAAVALPLPAILNAVKRWVKIEEAANRCRKMDEESCRAREGDGLTEAQWNEWWEAHCKAHDEAYDALDAALKEPS